MGKILIGPKLALGAQPVLLIGANVDDNPAFMVAGAGGVANIAVKDLSLMILRWTI